MKYKAKIDEEFCNYRDRKNAETDRDPNDTRWDYEFVENHICRVSGSGHKKWNGGVWKGEELTHHAFDTVHEFFGSCDFKYLTKENTANISTFTRRYIEMGRTDTIVFWRWVSHPAGSHRELIQPGQTGIYEIIDYIDGPTVLQNIRSGRFDYNEYLDLETDRKFLDNL